MTCDEKVRKNLRELSDLPDSVSDEQMMEMAHGSLLLARVELNVAGNEFIDAMAAPVAKAIQRIWPTGTRG